MDLVIYGASGLGKEVIDMVEDINAEEHLWKILGFIDKNYRNMDKVLGYEIIGDINWILEKETELAVIIAIANPNIRKNIVDAIKPKKNIKFPNIVSKNSIVSKYTTIGEGCIIANGASISTEVTLKNFVLVNTSTTIGHDCNIDDYVTINPGSNISGNVTISERSFIGTGSKIIEKKTIGVNTIVGAGAVVINDIPDNVTCVGVPAKIIKP